MSSVAPSDGYHYDRMQCRRGVGKHVIYRPDGPAVMYPSYLGDAGSRTRVADGTAGDRSSWSPLARNSGPKAFAVHAASKAATKAASKAASKAARPSKR